MGNENQNIWPPEDRVPDGQVPYPADWAPELQASWPPAGWANPDLQVSGGIDRTGQRAVNVSPDRMPAAWQEANVPDSWRDMGPADLEMSPDDLRKGHESSLPMFPYGPGEPDEKTIHTSVDGPAYYQYAFNPHPQDAEVNFAPDDLRPPVPALGPAGQVGHAEAPTGDPAAAERYYTQNAADKLYGQGEAAIAAAQAKNAQTQADYINSHKATVYKDAENQRSIELQNQADANDFATKRLTDLNARAQKLAETPIDNARWWKTRNAGQTVAALIAAIGGGLLSPYNGGKNTGLDAIFKMIDQDVDAQKFDIENQRAAIGQERGFVMDQYNLVGDLNHAKETARMGMLASLSERLGAEASQLDPRGFAAANIADARMRVDQKIKEHARKIWLEDQGLALQRRQVANAETATANAAANAARDNDRADIESGVKIGATAPLTAEPTFADKLMGVGRKLVGLPQPAVQGALNLEGMSPAMQKGAAIGQMAARNAPTTPLTPEQRNADRQDNALRSPFAKNVKGEKYAFPTSEEQQNFGKEQRDRESVLQQVRALEKAAGELSNLERTSPARFSEKKADVISKLSILMADYNKKIIRGGAFDQGLERLLGDALGHPDRPFDVGRLAGLANVKNSIRIDQDAVLNAYPDMDRRGFAHIYADPPKIDPFANPDEKLNTALHNPDPQLAMEALQSAEGRLKKRGDTLVAGPGLANGLDAALATVRKTGDVGAIQEAEQLAARLKPEMDAAFTTRLFAEEVPPTVAAYAENINPQGPFTTAQQDRILKAIHGGTNRNDPYALFKAAGSREAGK